MGNGKFTQTSPIGGGGTNGGGGFTPTAWAVEQVTTRLATDPNGTISFPLYDPKKEYVFAGLGLGVGSFGTITLVDVIQGDGIQGGPSPTVIQLPKIFLDDTVNGDLILDAGTLRVPFGMLQGVTALQQIQSVTLGGGLSSSIQYITKTPTPFSADFQDNLGSAVVFALVSRQMVA